MASISMDSIGMTGIGQTLLMTFKTVTIALTIALVMGLMIAITYYFIRPLAYRIEVNVFARRHGNYLLVGRDKAKVHKIRTKFFGLFGVVKQTKLKLLQRKIPLPTPNAENLYPNDKRNSPGTLNLLKYGEKDYAVCDLEVDYTKYEEKEIDGKTVKIPKGMIKLIPLETDMIAWHLQELRDSQDRNAPQDLLTKYGHVIAVGGVIIILMIGLYAGYQYYSVIFDNLGSALGHLDKTLESLNRCKI